MEVLKISATEAAWVWQTWQNFIQNQRRVGDSVPQEKVMLRPPPQEVTFSPISQ